jgi:hypothetical protein
LSGTDNKRRRTIIDKALDKGRELGLMPLTVVLD